MKHIKTEITIKARAHDVWGVLTDFEKYPDWNPFILSIEGEPEEGSRIKVLIQAPGLKPITFFPVVLEYDEERTFRWKGKLGIKGIFDGEHIFKIQDNKNGTTTLIQEEKITGILVPFVGRTFKKTEEGFNRMNEALKDRCESDDAS